MLSTGFVRQLENLKFICFGSFRSRPGIPSKNRGTSLNLGSADHVVQFIRLGWFLVYEVDIYSELVRDTEV